MSTRTPRTVRVLRAPAADPRALGPDWGEGGAATAGAEVGYVQGALAVDVDDAPDTFFGPQATASSELPDPGPWARQIVQAVLEVAEGTRGATQLNRWVTPALREQVARRGTLARRRGRRAMPRPVVRTVHVCAPADGVAEVSAVVWSEGRVRAVALRLCGMDGRWLVTAWEQG